MRTFVALTAATLTLGSSLALSSPASAHGDKEQREQMRLEGLAASTDGSPILSDTVEHVANIPGQVGISGCFMQTQPLFVTSGLDSLRVFDITDGTNPTEVGVLPSTQFENEAMNCGEQVNDGKRSRFALIGVDLYQTTPDPGGIDHTNVGGNELIVVDVTDPSAPVIRSRVSDVTTSTHTVTCVVDRNCRYAYSAGTDNRFSIIDLRNLDKPKEVDSNPDKEGVQGFRSPTAGHKWNFDNAGIGTQTGWGGSGMFNVDNPRKPKLITTTGEAGAGTDPKFEGYNDFIHHNSMRPNANAFKPHSPASVKNGNLLLVTEEDYEQTDCTQAGSFQTWKVNSLSGRSKSAIVPLDKVELSDLQAQQPSTVPQVQGAFCSSHWFDHRGGKLVAAGFYNGGTQFLDISDPRHIRSYGYAYWGPGSQVWDSRWVPIYDADGKQTGHKSNVAYSIDLVRGLDVYVVDLGDGRGTQPTPGVSPDRSSVQRAAGAVLPIGLVGGALALTVAVRRRTRRA